MAFIARILGILSCDPSRVFNTLARVGTAGLAEAVRSSPKVETAVARRVTAGLPERIVQSEQRLLQTDARTLLVILGDEDDAFGFERALNAPHRLGRSC